MLPKLTKREKEVFEFIKDFINSHKLPPTNREIAEHFGIAPKNAFKYLSILERKGYIKKNKKISRGITVIDNEIASGKKVPFISYVAAGSPIDIDEAVSEYYTVDSKIFPYDNIFMFKVIGDSMIDAHIDDGDIAVVSPDIPFGSGDIIVASIYNEITLKRFIKKDELNILHPENEKYDDIILNNVNQDEIKLIGKVVGIIRKMV